MTLKARLATRICRLLVKLHERYYINMDPSFPEPSQALGIWSVEESRSWSLTHPFGDASLTRLEKWWLVFFPSGNVMWPPGRRIKACRQQGFPSPIWRLFITIWVGVVWTRSSPWVVEHSISLNTLGGQNNIEWAHQLSKSSASHCCVLSTPTNLSLAWELHTI